MSDITVTRNIYDGVVRIMQQTKQVSQTCTVDDLETMLTSEQRAQILNIVNKEGSAQDKAKEVKQYLEEIKIADKLQEKYPYIPTRNDSDGPDMNLYEEALSDVVENVRQQGNQELSIEELKSNISSLQRAAIINDILLKEGTADEKKQEIISYLAKNDLLKPKEMEIEKVIQSIAKRIQENYSIDIDTQNIMQKMSSEQIEYIQKRILGQEVISDKEKVNMAEAYLRREGIIDEVRKDFMQEKKTEPVKPTKPPKGQTNNYKEVMENVVDQLKKEGVLTSEYTVENINGMISDRQYEYIMDEIINKDFSVERKQEELTQYLQNKGIIKKAIKKIERENKKIEREEKRQESKRAREITKEKKDSQVKDTKKEEKKKEAKEDRVYINTRTGVYQYKDQIYVSAKEKMSNEELEAMRKELKQKGSFVKVNTATLEQMDMDLYKFYEQIDKAEGTHFARNYLDVLTNPESDIMPTKVVYNINAKQELEGETEINKDARKQKVKLAKQQKALGLVEIENEKEKEKDKKVRVNTFNKEKITKIMRAAVVAIFGTLLLRGAQANSDRLLEAPKENELIEDLNNTEIPDDNELAKAVNESKVFKDSIISFDNEEKPSTIPGLVSELENAKKTEQSNTETLLAQGISALLKEQENQSKKDATKSDQEIKKTQEETKTSTPKEQTQEKTNSFKDTLKISEEKQVQTQTNQAEIGIGSKAYIEEGTYTQDSEGNGTIGKLENRQDKNLVISYIAVVGEDGLYKECTISGTVEEMQAKYPDCTIKVHLSTEKGNDYGWMEFNEIKDKFINQNRTVKNNTNSIESER